MSLELTLFIILGTLGIASAIGVIASKNPIASAMALVIHFLMLSGLYLTLNAVFMAAIQVLVYAGAIMVLVVFVIMLLNLGDESSIGKKIASRQGLGIGFSILLGGVLIFAVTRASFGTPGHDSSIELGSVQSVGTALFTTYVFPFEMISLVLLSAVVGAVVLTKKHLES